MTKDKIIKTAQRIIKTCEQNNRDINLFKNEHPNKVKLFTERNNDQIELFKQIIYDARFDKFN